MSKETTVESRAAKTPTNAPSSHGRGFWPSTALAYVDAEEQRLRKEGEALGIVDILPAAIIVDTSGETQLMGGLLVFGRDEAEAKKFCEKEEEESGLPVIWKDALEHPALRAEEGEVEGKVEGEGEGEEEGEDLAGEARQAQIVKLQPVPDRPGHFTTQDIFPPLQPISSPARHDSLLKFALAPTPSPLLREPVALISHIILEVDDKESSTPFYCSASLKSASLQAAHGSILLNATLEVSGNEKVSKVDFLEKVPYKVEEKEIEVSAGETDPKINVSGQAGKDPHLGFEREGAEHSSGWRLNFKVKDWVVSSHLSHSAKAGSRGLRFAPTTTGTEELELENIPLRFKLSLRAQSQDPLAHVELGAMLYKGGATRVTFSGQNCIYWMYHKVSSPIPGTAATTLEAKVVAEVISGETRSIAFEQIGYTATVPSSSPLTDADVLSHVVSETPRLARTKKTELLGLLKRTPYISSADIPTELPPTPPRGPMMRVPVGRQRSQSL